jgi:hypothetical protein
MTSANDVHCSDLIIPNKSSKPSRWSKIHSFPTEIVAQYLSCAESKDRWIIDVGSGTGSKLAAIMLTGSKHNAKHIVAVDPNPKGFDDDKIENFPKGTDPSSFSCENSVLIHYQPFQQTFAEYATKHKIVTKENREPTVLLLIWPGVDNGPYDYEAIKLAQPDFVILLICFVIVFDDEFKDYVLSPCTGSDELNQFITNFLSEENYSAIIGDSKYILDRMMWVIDEGGIDRYEGKEYKQPTNSKNDERHPKTSFIDERHFYNGLMLLRRSDVKQCSEVKELPNGPWLLRNGETELIPKNRLVWNIEKNVDNKYLRRFIDIVLDIREIQAKVVAEGADGRILYPSPREGFALKQELDDTDIAARFDHELMIGQYLHSQDPKFQYVLPLIEQYTPDATSREFKLPPDFGNHSEESVESPKKYGRLFYVPFTPTMHTLEKEYKFLKYNLSSSILLPRIEAIGLIMLKNLKWLHSKNVAHNDLGMLNILADGADFDRNTYMNQTELMNQISKMTNPELRFIDFNRSIYIDEYPESEVKYIQQQLNQSNYRQKLNQKSYDELINIFSQIQISSNSREMKIARLQDKLELEHAKAVDIETVAAHIDALRDAIGFGSTQSFWRTATSLPLGSIDTLIELVNKMPIIPQISLTQKYYVF